jgi:ABC-type nitrate/sulfonate/bicarbonate transport system substrate-binding protein
VRHAHHHVAADGLLCAPGSQRRRRQDRRLGGYPRQDAEQGIRRGAHAVADAARDHARRRLESDSVYRACDREHQRQAITLAVKHKDKRDPKQWKGFKFAVPFDYSMHNYLLRYFLAEHGLDPDKDVQIRSVPPPEMVANLRADNIDGFLAPDPVNQRAVYDGVGFIHILTKDLWDGHPCCAFAASKEFVTTMPNTYRALLKAIVDATAYAAKPENRKQIAEAIAPANFLNQPVTVVEQVLTGNYADGLGNIMKVPNRIDFDPFPWHSFAVWIMTQMKRWGQIKGDVDYAKVAREVFLATDAAKLMKEAGMKTPTATSKKIVIMGKDFDSAKPGRLHRELPHQEDGLMPRSTRLAAGVAYRFCSLPCSWGYGTSRHCLRPAGRRRTPSTRSSSAPPRPAGRNPPCRHRKTSRSSCGSISRTRSTFAARTTRASASSSPTRSAA